ncbi:hypothetical protein AU381_20215 [Sinorhizobium glycinis]|uniref:Uncharacterized protein n=1 Tax=Sinorhizobium glycinis TaxID=1472378 RepID=A0A178XNK5_9HYPH|nr:hypothetical protein AU381_20215 [Sinorhizobium glycinis]
MRIMASSQARPASVWRPIRRANQGPTSSMAKGSGGLKDENWRPFEFHSSEEETSAAKTLHLYVEESAGSHLPDYHRGDVMR